MQVFTIKQYSTAKEIPRLTRHTATLIQFYFKPTGASHKHLHRTHEKNKRVATSLFRVVPQRDRFSRVPPAWGTELVPARARVDGSRRSGLGPSSLQHATPPRPGSPRVSQAPHKTPSLLRELPENHTLRQLRGNSLKHSTLS